ncbi:MAG: hypothetical protein ACLP9L_18900 [Thermoguttaceae bacterium]
MGKKQSINRLQAVRDYVNAHPAATPSEIATALNKQGIKITSVSVATIKMWIYKTAVPATVEKPADKLTRDQVKMVAQAMKRVRSR